MSAEPKRREQTSSGGDHLLTEAHQKAADIVRRARHSEERIERAISRSAIVKSFCWRTEDDQELSFQLFVNPEEQSDIWALELLQVDYENPSRELRVHWETCLMDEIERQSDVWDALLSQLVE